MNSSNDGATAQRQTVPKGSQPYAAVGAKLTIRASTAREPIKSEFVRLANEIMRVKLAYEPNYKESNIISFRTVLDPVESYRHKANYFDTKIELKFLKILGNPPKDDGTYSLVAQGDFLGGRYNADGVLIIKRAEPMTDSQDFTVQ